MVKWKSFFILLRLLTIGATAVGIAVMVTSHDSTTVLNLTFEAKYSNTLAFKYFVIAEAIAGGYSLVAMLLSYKSFFFRLILMMDVVIAFLLCSSISAAMAIGQVGKEGNSHAGWLPICGQVPKFCHRVTGALVAGFVASLLYLILLLSYVHILVPHISIKP